MSFANLKISRKLIVAFASIVLALCALTGLVLLNLNNIDQLQAKGDTADVVNHESEDLRKAMLSMTGDARGYLLTRNEKFASAVAADKAAAQDNLAKLSATDIEPEEKAHVEAMSQASAAAFSEAAEPELQLARNPQTYQQAIAIVNSGVMDRHIAAFEAASKAFDDRDEADLAAYNTAEANDIKAVRMEMIVGALLALGIASFAGWFLTRMIAAPTTAMTSAMKRLAAGDNGVEIPAVGRLDEIGEMADAVQAFKAAAIEKLRVEGEAADERRRAEEDRARAAAAQAETARVQAAVVAQLAGGLEKLSAGELTWRLREPFAADYEKLRADFNAAQEQLQQAMGVISRNASGMRTGAGEISQAADDLSKRTEQQAATLEETAAALDEITATVKKTAEGAIRASGVVNAAKSDAEKSGEVVREAVAAMGQIEQSAQKISQIIGVIDEIAFQTNLLALNAGVEAARAGEAGRGFAVVASEVRALAQRSAEAAKEIKTLISASSQQVAQGVTLVGQTGEALTGIVTKVGEITGVVSEITASTQEQATALSQVNSAVNQMDQVTQQNAAMVEQSTAASHSLSQEAQELVRLVARFRVGDEGEMASVRRAASRAPEPRNRHSAVQMRTASQLARAPEAREDEWEEF